MSAIQSRYLRVAQVKAIYAIGRTTIYKLLRAGEIAAKKVGRATLVDRPSLEAWLERQPSFGQKKDGDD